MKISEFIEKLEEFKKENGNLDVGIRRDKVDDFYSFADLTLIRLNKFISYSFLVPILAYLFIFFIFFVIINCFFHYKFNCCPIIIR